VKRLDTPEKSNGKAVFGLDIQMPGLLTAVVARAPVFGGQVKNVDSAAAKAVPGVRHVYEVPSGVAVVADHYWAAKKGRDALKIEWDLGAGEKLETKTLRKEFAALVRTEGTVAKTGGDAGLWRPRRSSMPSTACCTAHAAMEPWSVRCGRPDGAEIHMGTQFVDQMVAAKILGSRPRRCRSTFRAAASSAGGRRPRPTSIARPLTTPMPSTRR
jgi:isoquinoline 1-oxidoreductase beta subunit